MSAEATWELPLGASACGQARWALRGWLAAAGIDPADGLGAEIVLAASELVANASVHGLPPVLLNARLTGDRVGQVVTVRVNDASRQLPELTPFTALAEHGRGLAIVAALALRWGTGETPGGKETWFEIAVPASADSTSSGPTACHNGPFGLNDAPCPGATRREVLAS
jgi:anti-sigma regulatory factor (Ser/Thr protein kinase)